MIQIWESSEILSHEPEDVPPTTPITPEGIKPNPKKIQAIQALQRPTTVTEVRSFIGMVQYYRDLWPRRSHILQPFTEVSAGKKGTKIKWTEELESSFHQVKKMVCQQTMLTYPDWSQPFDVHTDLILVSAHVPLIF